MGDHAEECLRGGLGFDDADLAANRRFELSERQRAHLESEVRVGWKQYELAWLLFLAVFAAVFGIAFYIAWEGGRGNVTGVCIVFGVAVLFVLIPLVQHGLERARPLAFNVRGVEGVVECASDDDNRVSVGGVTFFAKGARSCFLTNGERYRVYYVESFPAEWRTTPISAERAGAEPRRSPPQPSIAVIRDTRCVFVDCTMHGPSGSGILGEPVTLFGHPFPVGTEIHFRTDGSFMWARFPDDQLFQTLYSSVWFHESGLVSSGWLKHDGPVQGVICASVNPVSFHDNGKIHQCTLGADQVIQGERLQLHSYVAFDRDGTLVASEPPRSDAHLD